MRNQSKTEFPGQLARIDVDDAFPVSIPDFNTRSDEPDVGPHIHDLLEIGYCFDGSGIFLVGNKIFPFKAGDAVVINTHEVHQAKANPGQTTSWGFLYLDPVRLLSDNIGSFSACLKLSRYCGSGFKNVIDGSEKPDIADCIRRILLERRDMPKDYRGVIRSLTWQMMLLLNRYYDGNKSEDTSGDYRDMERIVAALNYMGVNFNREVDIPHLAALCFTSESNFRKLFHRAMGCAPQPYLLKMRLNIACAMLKNTDESILAIALHCGYNNLSNFNRQFREKYGISPREYRRNS